jgi:glycosyltransferase involved in cell wall biosynthesis
MRLMPAETTQVDGVPLAIVIPAYKARFLRDALESIARQTSKNFRLYVGDDCSPEPVGEVVREFAGRLDIHYHRFDANLGGVSLARQWERCLRLTREPWLWCFGDDDCMEPGCVAAFLEELRLTQAGHDLYRFNTVWIDGAGAVISESPKHPLEETGGDFLRARLRGVRNSTLQELIFSRTAWERSGGIPDLPLGWGADDAFIAQLGKQKRLRTIPGPRVQWRLSDVNISNSGSNQVAARKIKASAELVRWTTNYFKGDGTAAREEIARLTEQWFQNYVSHLEKFLGRETIGEIDRLGAEVWGWPRGAGRRWAMGNNARVGWQKLRRRLGGKS